MLLGSLVNTGVKRFAPIFVFFASAIYASGAVVSSGKSGLTTELNEATGEYRITAEDPSWSFAGTLGSAPHDVRTAEGNDRIGAYRELTFTWDNGQVPLEGTIRLYQYDPLVLFRYTYVKAANPPSVAFPNFTEIPAGLHHFSYKNSSFAPPQFKLEQYGTPWLFFDDRANAMVMSPASHFIIAAMQGDGDHLIASGLNKQLPGVTAGFTQQTMMAISPGIRRTWNIWGTALTRLGGKERPGNESDITLKYYGYWTDNGAAYYYKFDPALGYTGTLEAVIERYRNEKIPVRYLQIDSWWYDKSYPGMRPDDQTGNWEGFDGTMVYRADASLFPQGLKAFQKSVGLPLVTHGRWISEQSPYRKNYQISGIAPVGAKWWNETAAYLESNGVVTYEQDWQNRITEQSPAFSNTIETGDDFYGHMAESSKAHGLTMQYCMALPSDFLEGSLYGNLTTIRTSGDRFSRLRWRNFLYTSQLAYAVGSWPWTDAYFSYETDNLLLGTLSAGPVGTGDVQGAESRDNILKAVRADGVIIKPDVPIMPLDRMYLADAAAASTSASPVHLEGQEDAESPFIANTWTKEGSRRTAYVFAFSGSGKIYQTVRFNPEEAGSNSPAFIYDFFAHRISHVARGQKFEALIGPGETGYYIVAPVGPSGMALFGDQGNFVSMGKERIASIEEGAHSITAQVLFAAGEDSETLFGSAPSAPTVAVRDGSAGQVTFRKSDGYFSVKVSPAPSTPAALLEGDPVRRITVEFTLP